MAKNVQIISPLKWDFNTKKVGIYCRIRSNSSFQLHNLADQASGLAQFACRQPLMVNADIFLDTAFASDVVNQPEFKECYMHPIEAKSVIYYERRQLIWTLY